MGLIYKATLPSGKSYVGKTINLKFRIRSHKYCCNRGVNSKFYNAMRKYGFDNISWEILEDNIPDELLNIKECEWIEIFDSYKNGYNDTLGGERCW